MAIWALPRCLNAPARPSRQWRCCPRHRGHFYNWYDTLSLAPLPPRYVSTVDSGNLAGHLITLRVALLALPRQRVVNARLFEGLVDTLDVLEAAAGDRDGAPIVRLRALVNNAISLAPATLSATLHSLGPLVHCAQQLALDLDATPGTELADWTARLLRQSFEAQTDLLWLAPWQGLAPGVVDLSHFPELDEVPTLGDLASHSLRMAPMLRLRMAAALTDSERNGLHELSRLVDLGGSRAGARIETCRALAAQAIGFADIDCEFLYDRARHLLAIGYNVDEFRRDNSYYDLLASEARLASFVAIAQGRLPQESWFALGRLRSAGTGEPILTSWSGSMFEYLMPLLGDAEL